jgi:hypothetical protein
VQHLKNCGHFLRFSDQRRQVSLHFRLRGDAELIGKAIRNFRMNPANDLISRDGAKFYAQERCRAVANALHRSRIEI